MKMKRYIIVMICILFTAGTVFAQMDLQSVAIVRLIRSEPITVKQLRTSVEEYERREGRALTAEERRQVLDGLINQRLVLQAAERDRITVSDAEINNQLQQARMTMSQSLGRQPTDQEFEIAIRNETGSDLETFRNEMRTQMLLQKYLMEKKRSIFESVTVPTEQEILNTYNLTKSQFVRPDTVRVSMISIPAGNNAAERERARALADRLAAEIGSDASKFDETVIRSQAPNSGYQGGDAGYLPRNLQAQQALGADFVNTAFSLRQGEVSRLIESPRAFQIIKITETYTQKSLELTDPVQLGNRMTVHDFIRNTLMQERQAAAIERATQELTSELRQGNSFQIFENALNW